MNKTTITSLLIFLMSMVGVKTFAIAVINDEGKTLYYNIINDKTEVSVTFKSYYSENYNFTDNVIIPETIEYDGITYKVTGIGDDAFRLCKFTSITIPNSVTTIGKSAFYGCSELISVKIPNSVTSIGDLAFDGCSSLVSIEFPNSLTSIGLQAFMDCSSLTSITIPNSVTFIGSNAFRGCSNLASVDIPNSVTSISAGTFYGCSGLTSITIPNSVTCIYSGAFRECTRLTSVTIPNSVTNIERETFCGCSALYYIDIPNSLISIGYEAFAYCTSLTTIKSAIEIPFEIGEKVFYKSSSPNSYSDFFNAVTLIVPTGTKNAYTSTTGWNKFKNIVEFGEGGLVGKNFVEDSIYYKIGENNTASLVSFNKKFSGDFEIPTQVSFNGVSYFVTGIGSSAFAGCDGLKSIIIPNSIVSIDWQAFARCNCLTSITIPENVENITREAFYQCPNLSSVILNSNIFVSVNRNVGTNYKFVEIFGNQVNSYTLGNSITRIGNYAFADCSNMKSIIIPNSINQIGTLAFRDCTGLEKVVISDISAWCDIKYDNIGGNYNQSSPLFNAKHLYLNDDTEIKELIIPEGVTSIGRLAFANCKEITSITFPSSLETIGEFAFLYCDGLTSVSIPEGVTDINAAFWGCSNLTSIKLPNRLTEIKSSAFANCTSLTNVNIPANLTSIGNYAFGDCTNISTLTFPDNITFIGSNSFSGCTKLYCNNNTSTLLALWEAGYNPYLIGTETLLEFPNISVSVVSTTQTTATFKIENYQKGFIYTFNEKEIEGDMIELNNLFPEIKTSTYVGMSISGVDQVIKKLEFEYTTAPISPTIDIKSTASSVNVSVSYIKGDAEVTSQRLVMNPSDISSRKIYGGTDVEDLTYFASGFDPGRIVASFAYEIIVSNGNNTKRYYTNIINASTAALTLATQQPKIVSIGNAIVAADSNLDDEEENVGFEWRRTDWTDDFASNTGRGAVFEGRMEGYIRNLNTEKLWKYRPYYLSNSGTYYYGDWVGLDPTNTSYFEPTVHTYEKTIIEGNTALVKGYALTGTDKITVQGFKYWKQTSNARGVSRISVPSDAMTIEASGQVMTATLTNLDIGATYNYLSFVTTSEGETFYGELKEFTTGEEEKDGGDADGDGNINASDIVAIVKHIIGNPANGSADVNGDGKVNVADIVKLVNIIMDKE